MSSIPPLGPPATPPNEDLKPASTSSAPAPVPQQRPANTFQTGVPASGAMLTGASAAQPPPASNFSLGNFLRVFTSPTSFIVPHPVLPLPTLGTAALTWVAPTRNTDGSVINDLAGFNIYYGTSPSNLDKSIKVPGGSLTHFTINGLTPGTWYFAVTAYNAEGKESALSNEADKTFPL